MRVLHKRSHGWVFNTLESNSVFRFFFESRRGNSIDDRYPLFVCSVLEPTPLSVIIVPRTMFLDISSDKMTSVGYMINKRATAKYVANKGDNIHTN